MRAYLGPLGALVRLPYMCTVSQSMLRNSVERVTLGGKTRMQVSRETRRTWTVSADMLRPDEIGSLQELLDIGRPPWSWVEPWSQVTNLLTPAQSTLTAGTFQGSGDLLGRVDLGRGQYTSWSLAPQGWIDIGQRTPVEPGLPVSGSLWLAGSRVEVCLVWQHADGQYEETKARVSEGGDRVRRVAVSARPPSTARSVALRIKGASMITRPALTWTPKPVEWHHGQGCNSAIVLGLDQAIILAYREQRSARAANISFQVQEVG